MGTGRRRKSAYLKDFQRKEDGSYGYTGTHMQCALDKRAFRREMMGELLLSLLPLTLAVGAGCVRGTGMEGCFYLLLPYAGGLVVMLLILWALLQMLHAGPKLRLYVYERTARTLPRRTIFGVVLSAAALAGVVYGLITREYRGRGYGGAFFVISQVAVLIGCGVNFGRVRRIKWKSIQ